MKAEKFWDFLSKQFDQSSTSIEDQIGRLDLIKKRVNKNDIALDFGCATGALTIEFAKYIKTIYGIDFSSKMIEIAKCKVQNSKTINLVFKQAEINDTQFEKQSFDVVFAFNILHLLQDPNKDLHRINELLKPGGLLISKTVCLDDKKSFAIHLLHFFSWIKVIPILNFLKHQNLVQLIQNAGFVVDTVEILGKKTKESFIISSKKG